jgi:UDP-N-acetylenolpyruvoylglucosamine reductase
MIELLEKFGNVSANVSLKNYNTYKIASSARFLVEPTNIDSLLGLINYL